MYSLPLSPQKKRKKKNNGRAMEKKGSVGKMRRFQLRTSICRKSLVCAISVADAPNHDRKRERKREGEREGGWREREREYAVARSRTVSSRTFPSFSSFRAPFVSPAQPSSSLPLAVSPLSTSSLGVCGTCARFARGHTSFVCTHAHTYVVYFAN